ncbi:hypothetical protein AB1Y20_005764 [Prymnesium parvum]|uniref:Fe2OG dioxygenase domain-containing protein n=1 Tax=Prymnesium parvum TaxID=97485 RepID=A0AB34J2Z9_PRYPA
MASCRTRGTRSAGWRHYTDLPRVAAFLASLADDDRRLYAAIDASLSQLDATLPARLARSSREQAMDAARADFGAAATRLASDAVRARDLRLLRAAATAPCLSAPLQLGLLAPPWLRWRELAPAEAARALAASLDATRAGRAHALAQRVCREVSVRRGRARGGARRVAALAAAGEAALGGEEVRRLRRGEAVVLEPRWLRAEQLRVAEAELRAHVRRAGRPSDSSCNAGARSCALPLLGEGYELSECTRELLRRLCGVPALVEQHGWPRPLCVPPLLQLATYAGGAHYTKHLDSNEWEQANWREITILLYLNDGWDAARHGGCLRVYPPEGGQARDVEPISGRLVLFQSRHVPHEVLPCTQGAERLAVTLWVEYAEEQ